MSLNLKEKKKALHPAAMQNGFADLSHVSVRRWFIAYAIIIAAAVGVTLLLPSGDRPLGYAFILLTAFTTFTPGNVTYVVSLFTPSEAAPGFIAKYLDRVVNTSGWQRDDLLLVALVCAVAAIIANLNDYHGLVLVFRANKVRKFGKTLFYRKADRWFEQAPFFLLLAVNFLPLPVSVVRWFAVTRAYPRWRLALAGFLGRLPRYWLTAVFFKAMELQWWMTLLVCVIIALIPVIIMRIRGRTPQAKGEKATGNPPEADE